MKMQKLRHNQAIRVGNARIVVCETSRGYVTLGIDAPRETPIGPIESTQPHQARGTAKP